MNRKSTLTIAAAALLILALVIGYAGLSGERILLPPVITAIGFLVIAWVFFSLRSNRND